MVHTTFLASVSAFLLIKLPDYKLLVRASSTLLSTHYPSPQFSHLFLTNLLAPPNTNL